MQHASYSSIPVISKAQLELLIKDPKAKYTLVDVRNPDEVQRSGLIPTAKCLPLPNLISQLEAGETEGLPEDKEEKVIFYCHVGQRSNFAAQLAQGKGYKNVINYAGSAREWFN